MNTMTLKSLVLRCLVGLLAVAAIAFGIAPATQAATGPLGYFNGDAYSTYGFTNAGPINAKLGRLTYLPCACTGTDGQVKSASLPSLDAGVILQTQTLYASVYTARDATKATVKNTAEINGLKALGGLIKADKVVAVANTVADATTIKSSDKGYTFVNLRIGGAIINPSVAANTKFDLAGIGHVIVRETTRSGNNNNATFTENMLHVFVTVQNNQGLPVGAQIILGHASSGFVRAPIQVQYSGNAFVTSAKAIAGPVGAQLGNIAPSYIGCQGTGGKTNTNNIASLSVANILVLNTGATTAFGGPQNGNPVSKTAASVKNVNLLNRMITADAMNAVAQATFSGGMGSTSSAGSQFVNLKVNGTLRATVQANTKVNLPGIGYAILYEEKKSETSGGAAVTVNMIHVYVNQNNNLGLPVGSEILVSSAGAGVRPF